MKKLLIIALATGLLIPISSKADIGKTGAYKGCMAGMKRGWEFSNPSMPLSFEEESGYKQTCLCIENLVKKKKLYAIKSNRRMF